MNKLELYQTIKELLDDAYILVNLDNMDLYDESSDYAIDYDKVMKKLDERIKEYK